MDEPVLEHEDNPDPGIEAAEVVGHEGETEGRARDGNS